MNRLKDMDEITAKICGSCDALNNDVPLNKKNYKCKSMEKLLNCELVLFGERLKNRVAFLKGEIGPIFVCGKDGYIDTFELLGVSE